MNATKQNKSISAKKKDTEEGFSAKLKAHAKIQALLKAKNLPTKVTYAPLAPSHSIIESLL